MITFIPDNPVSYDWKCLFGTECNTRTLNLDFRNGTDWQKCCWHTFIIDKYLSALVLNYQMKINGTKTEEKGYGLDIY
jgi:hypothetical protein